MARDDYDDFEDAHDDDFDDYEDYDDGDARGLSYWLRKALLGALAALALFLGFLVPYMLYLNHQVGTRFGQLQWQLPTRVYARPLQLQPGIALTGDTLKSELELASYRDDGVGDRPGSYARKGNQFMISSRGFNDVGGVINPHRITVTLNDGAVASLRDRDNKAAMKVTRLDPARIGTLYGRNQEERELVRLEELPEKLVTGLQAVEDKDFAHHFGVDLTGVLRAIWINLKSGDRKQGASTLTQQLARSGLLGIGKEQTYTRKFKEMLYAVILEARYDKRTILETYFNQVYLGQQGNQAIHGVAAASKFWYGRNVRDLSNEQIALLIAIVRGPSWYDPRKNPERALERRNFVLEKMLQNNVLTQKEYEAAVKAPLGVTKTPEGAGGNRFPAYVELVRRQLASDYSYDDLSGAGMSVMTAMSPSAQAYAEGSVSAVISSVSSRRRPALDAGLVMTNVHNGEVVAVVGSKNYTEAGFNRALDAKRPIGSLIKPFEYMLALAQPGRWSLATYVDDSPVSVILGNGKRWNPSNSDNQSHGSVRVIDALAQSYNQATVRLGMAVQTRRVAELMKVLAGIDTGTNPSLLLGATDQSPYAMAQAYQFLASGGEIQPLRSVRGVLDRNGKALKRYDKAPAPAQEGDAIAARLVTFALQRVVSGGTARQLMSDGFGRLTPAGKTGTSNDSRDSWYAGYTGDHLAVIWVGNDQNKPTGLYGATGAMRVWSSIFKKLPTAPLQLNQRGLDWQWVSGSNATEAGCPGAQRLPFVQGYAPPFQSCAPAPEPAPFEDPNALRPDGTEPMVSPDAQDIGQNGWPTRGDPARQVQPVPQNAPVEPVGQ